MYQEPAIDDSSGMLPNPTFSEKTHRPKPPRCKNPSQARSIHDQFFDNDTARRIERTEVQALLANERPFSAQKMKAAGLEGCSNFDFRIGSDAMRKELAPYANTFISTKCFMKIKCSFGDEDTQERYSNKLSEGFTRMLRSWPEFMFRYLYCSLYTRAHGTAFAYFDNNWDWRWYICAQGDMLVPELTKADTTDFGVADTLREYQVKEIYDQIKGFTPEDWDRCKEKDADGEYGRYNGWHLPSAVQAMQDAEDKDFWVANDFELNQRLWEENEIYYSRSEKVVKCIIQWWTEGDGKVSMYICSKDRRGEVTEGNQGRNAGDAEAMEADDVFLYKKIAKYECMSRAIIMFYDGLGSNGYVHTIHGRGGAMYPMVRKITELGNRLMDSVSLAMSVAITGTEEALNSEFAFINSGPFWIVNPGINILEPKVRNLGKEVLPGLEFLEQKLTNVLPRPQGENPTDAQQMFNQMQSVDPLSSALWYHSWQRLLTESLRRCQKIASMDRSVSGGGYVWDWMTWCGKNGIAADDLQKVFASIDIEGSYAVSPIGDGNPEAMYYCFEQMEKLIPFMDEKGKNNYARHKAVSLPGMKWQHVDEFIPPVADMRPGVETKVAIMENQMLMQFADAMVQRKGEDQKDQAVIPALPDEPHLLHINKHLEPMQEIMDAVDETHDMSLVEGSVKLYPLFLHAEQHLEFLGDGTPGPMQKELGEKRKAIEIMGEIIVNGQRRLRKMQGQQQQQGEQAQPGQQPPGQLDPKQMEAVVKAQVRIKEAQRNQAFAAEEHQIKMQQIQSDASQKRAQRSAESAAKIAAKYLSE